MKKTTSKARGQRAVKIRVTSTNKPPLDAAAAFARLLVASHNKNAAAPAFHGCGCQNTSSSEVMEEEPRPAD